MYPPKDYSSQCFVDERVNAYYASGGRRMTKEEAIDAIRVARDKYWIRPGLGWSKRAREIRLTQRFMSYEVVRMMRADNLEDPIRILWNIYSWLDDILAEGDMLNGNSVRTTDMMSAIRETLDCID